MGFLYFSINEGQTYKNIEDFIEYYMKRGEIPTFLFGILGERQLRLAACYFPSMLGNVA